MTTVVSIVEGDGEVRALPVLLRRLGEWKSPGAYVAVERPIRVRRDQFLNKEDVFRKQLGLARHKCDAAGDGWILILLDADNDCPAELASLILSRAQTLLPDYRISVVLAKREYEAWFLAAASSLDGVRGWRIADEVPDPDAVRGAKEWLRERHQARRYDEIIDQPALSAAIDLQLTAQRSRSFRKLCREWEKHVDVASESHFS